MATKCNICWTACVTCKWWRCKCDFSEEEARISNTIYPENNINFWVPWIFEYYRSIIKKYKQNWYNNDDIINMINDYVVPEWYEKIETKKEIKVNQWGFCEYPSWNLSAWDVCIRCWTARFYWQNKPCSWNK